MQLAERDTAGVGGNEKMSIQAIIQAGRTTQEGTPMQCQAFATHLSILEDAQMCGKCRVDTSD